MKRIVLCFLTAMLALSFHAGAQAVPPNFPAKPIRFIMPYPPGGSSEILARPIAQEMTRNLGQPVVIDYKYVKAEVARWAKVVKDSGAKIE
jgi:tripartite-type tricarboxylate transporter receptor subunit TctC